MKPFPFLTADDWGMSPAINAAILELAELGGICRISMMPCERFMNQKLERLKSVPGLRFGLHFNLTHQKPYRSPVALLKAYLFAGKMEKIKINSWAQNELLQQISAMKDLGLRVDYFDGHQHVHLIPGLFEKLSFLLKAEGIGEVRTPYDPHLWLTPKFPISLLALGLRRKLHALGFKTLDFFYPHASLFKNPQNLLATMKKNAHKEILVHPATHDDLTELHIDDEYRSERVTEFQALQMVFRDLNSRV